MSDAPDWTRLLPRPLRRLPADIAATVALTLVGVLLPVLPVLKETPLRVLFGLPLVLFLPGYALVAALFPEAGSDDAGIDGVERVALSFGLSIAVTPLLGLVLNFTPWGIRLIPILVAVGGFTLVAAGVAAVRRWETPSEERFRVPYREWASDARVELLEPDTTTDAALNVLLAVSVLVAVASVGYAVTVPQQGEAFTEFYYLTYGEDGDLVADDYPSEMVVNESAPLVVGVGNHEHRAQNYTWVLLEQQVHVENNTTLVDRSVRLETHRLRLAANETRHTNVTITPAFAGERQRFAFVLYKGEPPADPSVESAYREVHLWANVTEASA
ncbi:hypothetical protein GCM10009037_30460 [Halarchaeum grantii]|uniref:DUF1616 domain-containing protein n=1 Tax=Halarchaeum grantii TaxID=1193105 RepID=A0A830F6X4_9EURY|nr:DUF1616 domain-containing protein [Halarchaeum grantii]GGL44967.1 hypothetical protein GCM10009037_30460 [Halarchaeum grantii]